MKKPPPKSPTKVHVLGVRVDTETKDAIKRAADAESRSVSQWLSLTVQAALKGRKK